MKKRLGSVDIKIFVGVLLGLSVIGAIVAVVRLDTTGKKGSGLGKEYEYDVKELTRIDPNLILYEELAEAIKTDFANTHGIAVDLKGSVYVAGDKAIRIFARSGKQLSEIKLDDMPRCLTVTADGMIYAGMKDHVEVYDAQGKQQASWESLGQNAVLTSIVVSKDNVFVADAGHRIVIRYDTAGKVINEIGKRDTFRNIPGFVVPSPYFDLAVPRDGLLRVVNPGRLRIEAYTFDGDLEFWWGEPSATVQGFCGCCNPVNFAILEDESFVTCEKGLIRVKIYDPEGAFVGVVAGPEQLVEGDTARIGETAYEGKTDGFDVAVDASGRIFVLDTIKNVIRIFTRIKAEQ